MPAFVVSVPFTESPSNVSAQFESFRRKVSLPADQFSIFEVPGLKVGTLDTLMECSDDLNKIDNQVEVITFKTLQLLEEISGTSELAQISKPSGSGQSQCSIREYLATFRWNEAQYPLNKPLKALIQHIHESVNKGEENIRTRMSEYNEIRTKVQGIKKKSGGSLAVKPIASIVKEFYRKLGDEGPVDSEYLTTLFVAVPIVAEKDWLKEWYTLVDDLVVPGTSLLVEKDSEYCLYTVIVFKKIAEKYKHLCREKRWLVRDFKSDEEVTDAELEELNSQMEQKKNNLIRWLRNTFSESYSAFIHLKAIRIFVESILRYGVPPNFLSVIFQVEAKREKDLRKQLNTNYTHLNPKKLGMEENEDALNALEQQYPYISIKVKSSTSDQAG